MSRRLGTLLALLAMACDGPSVPPPPDDAVLWPEADALFHQDPRWLGGDAAFSVDLGGERTLWLFGDTFVGRRTGSTRRDSVMVRNSLAIMEGRDPSTATMAFVWREPTAGSPEAFFANDGEIWRWPGHGIRAGGALTLFLARLAPSDEGFGFEAVGWDAARITNPDSSPEDWAITYLPTVAIEGLPLVMGIAVVREGGFVHVYGVHEPGSHDLYLARYPEAAFAAGVDAPEWWTGDEWTPHASLTGRPAVVTAGAHTELSVHRLDDGRYAQVQSLGFGATTIGVRTAPALEGPWSEATSIFRPPESRGDRPFVYAGKAHPELTGAELVVTYADNAWDFAALLDDESIYFPHFLRLGAPR